MQRSVGLMIEEMEAAIVSIEERIAQNQQAIASQKLRLNELVQIVEKNEVTHAKRAKRKPRR